MLLNELIAEKLESLRKERKMRMKKNKDIYLRTLLILLRTLGVTAEEFFADPRFSDEELDIDFK